MSRRNEAHQQAARYAAAPPAANSRFPAINFDNSGPPQANIGYTPQNQFGYGGHAPPGPPPLLPPGGGQSWQAPPSAPTGQAYNPPPSAPIAYGQHPTSVQFQRVMPQHQHHSASHMPMRKQASGENQWMPPPPTVLPQAGTRANKKALIIGCNYANTQYELQGCIHDAKNIEYMLQTQFGFRKENIRLLTDDGKNFMLPTKDNIFASIKWLIKDVQSGDSLFFHFSGHGSQKPDYTGDERDGLNETLLPCDFRRSGQIIDDDINERLINPLPRGVYLHAVIDACHSGTAMDLEFFTKRKNGNIEWRSEGPTRKYKGTAGGIAVLFSACADSQVAQDTDNLTGGVHTGAATHAFIEAIVENGPRLSYLHVLSHMYKTMEKLSPKPTASSGFGGRLLDKLADGLMSVLGIPNQTPQLSSNVKLNLNETLHI